jgi:predicted NBD/HSP70 family sugar kinase
VRALPATLRLLNQRRLLELILRVGSASRAELAEIAGMSRPTAGKIVDELIEAGVVEESDAEPEGKGPGRPGRRLVPEARTPRFLLIEMGVRYTRLAATPVAATGDDPWTVVFPTPRSEQKFIRRIVEARSSLPLRRPWAFALSMPGIVDEREGTSFYNPNLQWTHGTNLLAGLRQALGIPGCVMHEARALALGHMAAHPDERDFLIVDADDGVGAAAVLRGQLFEGALPFGGELGHTRITGNRRRCGCGATGCVETLIARPGLLASFSRTAGRSRTDADWADVEAALARDPRPRFLLDGLDACGDVVAGALNVLGLDRVVLTGLFERLPPPAIVHIKTGIARGSLAARFDAIHVGVAPRRRARGLLAAIIDRLLIPTSDWAAPCEPSAAA